MKSSKIAFWDCSAILPLCLRQDETSFSVKYAQQFPRMIVWWSTIVECQSGVARVRRRGELSEERANVASRRLSALQSAWYEILPSESIRSAATELLSKFPLSAADALQLAAALKWCSEKPRGRFFVSFDRRLGEVADRVGFSVLAS
jgi:predicted nucleic acid-binding protein